jgi:hypothetical protein
MLFLVHSEEVTAMAIFNQFAVGNLNIFKNLKSIIHDGKYFETRRKRNRDKQSTRMLNS